MRAMPIFFRVLLASFLVSLSLGIPGDVSAGSTSSLVSGSPMPAILTVGSPGDKIPGSERAAYRAGAEVSFKAKPRPELSVVPGPDLRVPRWAHTATRLTDGRILLVGGIHATVVVSETVTEILPTEVDIFDPATGQTSQAAPLNNPRHGHTATLLPDGRILVVGGYADSLGWLADAEVYDPAANTWTVVPPGCSHGVTHTATLLRDGRVLVVGGSVGSGQVTDCVEIFDPQANAWTGAPSLAGARANHTAQLLRDGRVLVAGGQTNDSGLVGGDAVLYDPRANTWTATGSMIHPRIWAQSVRLQDGRVLVAGGMTLEDMPSNTFTASAEIYNPDTNTWAAATSMAQPRYGYSLVLLSSRKVLAAGGASVWECCWNEDSLVHTIEVFDPVADQWRIVADLPQPRVSAAGVQLSDGRVWLSGGRTPSASLSDTWWLIAAK